MNIPGAPKPTAPREEHEAFAKLRNYFWMPCPRCGKFFGGHEWRHGAAYSVQCEVHPPQGHGTCCAGALVSKDSRSVRDPEVCEKAHKRQAKEGESK